MYHVHEITNIPNFNRDGFFSRDIGTFQGEWGDLKAYPNSIWHSHEWFFTSDLSKEGTVVVTARDVNREGHVRDTKWDHEASICRGD